jgi:hypothetical protein
MQFGCDAPVPITGKLQHNALNGIAQRHVPFGLCSCFGTGVVPGMIDVE